MYSLSAYARMLVNDPDRRQALLGSLRNRVDTGSVVLDLGAGVGLLTVICCHLGARHVYAIEPNPCIRFVAKLAKRNNCADRVTWFHADSRAVELPEKVDIIISDIRGSLSVVGGAFDIVTDAVKRFLKPGGIVIPARDLIQVAPVTEHALNRELRRLWLEHDLQVDLSGLHDLEMGHVRGSQALPEDLLSAHQCWGQIDWNPVPCLNFERELVFTFVKDGRLDGFVSWFDLVFDENCMISNCPGRNSSIYGRAVFCLSNPIVVYAGWRASLRLSVHQNAAGEVWTWSGQVTGLNGKVERCFFESSLKGQAIGARSQLADEIALSINRAGSLEI